MCSFVKSSFFMMFIIIFYPLQTYATIQYPTIPALPEEDQEERIAMIIVVNDQPLSKVKRRIRQSYPSVLIRHQFQTAFTGFSVEGKRGDLEKLMKESYISHASPVATYETHIEESVPFIGGEQIRGYFNERNERLTGKGVTVAIVDTGIDYTHPDLRHSFKGGYDFVDIDTDPMETKANELGATIHGTHVAGIIAADGKLKGMAPDASIIMYRALGPNGMGTSEQVIAAIEKAIEDKVDVLNLSLGNDVNGPDWPTSLALNKAVEKGIIAVVSSGNSGPKPWTVGSPGTASKAISVGASTPPIKVPYLSLSGYRKQIKLLPLYGAKEWDLTGSEDIIYAKLGEEEDFPNDVQGKVVLLKRGKLSFTEKVQNSINRGAKAVLIYNDVKGRFIGHLEKEFSIPVASISKEDGEWLRHNLKNQTWLKTVYKKEVDTLADFSSRGPVTTSWDIKPDVVAPGVAIDSTIPSGYLALQGTSMAAPHVAGACALIKQVRPNWTPEQVKASLMNSAKPLKSKEGNLLPAYEQGAGRIDVVKAIQTEALVYPASITFGQLKSSGARVQKQVTLTLDNQSNYPKKFIFLQPDHREGIQWKLPKTIVIRANEQKQVTVTADITPSLFHQGVYDGSLYVQADDQQIRIPYLFVTDEPDYPRLMGFEFGLADIANTFHYELYLPGGADEFGIALYDPDTLRFIGFLDWERNVKRGLRSIDIKKEKLHLPEGLYKAIIFAKKGEKEDQLETDILLDLKLLKSR
ncbi:S8 family serine peptidase [Bacillus sp. FJAT-47783]|uniref:S8 family serine peptidase n=1 Tax=Bacillus sp. FJAT-47783 TaxID=2922712 RepID=UPI002434FBB6|nr:S8 family serine peptidase [Bacillus sp. FJAT-47783]